MIPDDLPHRMDAARVRLELVEEGINQLAHHSQSLREAVEETANEVQALSERMTRLEALQLRYYTHDQSAPHSDWDFDEDEEPSA